MTPEELKAFLNADGARRKDCYRILWAETSADLVKEVHALHHENGLWQCNGAPFLFCREHGQPVWYQSMVR